MEGRRVVFHVEDYVLAQPRLPAVCEDVRVPRHRERDPPIFRSDDM